MKQSLLFIFLSLCITAFAQKPPAKFGDIPMEDMKMVIYDKDSSAEAVFLFDFGKAFIEVLPGGPQLSYERHARIKILKTEGLSWADASISLYHSNSSEEHVNNFKAVTYNLENGKIVETKVSKDGIFKEKFNDNINKQKFTFPNVKAGSILEYTYITKSDFFTSFPNWQFQRTIPVRFSEYWAIFPEIFLYEKYMQGYVAVNSYDIKPQLTADIQSNAHHWITKDIPAFKEEPYMTCEDDYVSKINFALAKIQQAGQAEQDIMGSWESLNKNLMEDENFGKVIAKSGFLKDKALELTAGMTEPMQKIAAIQDYVRKNVNYSGVEDFYAGNLKKIIEEKKGSSGDINLMLASLLDKAGFEVDMVLLSTRDHGFIRPQYPMSRQFNYVICAVRVGDKSILLDATEKYLPMTTLPERCLNGQGLIISKTFKGWIDIASKAKSKTIVSADFTLSPEGELQGMVTYTRDGYDALQMRKDFKDEDSYKKDFSAGKSWTIEESTFTDVKDLDKPVKESYKVSIGENGTTANDIIYLNPFVSSQIKENPFKDEKRVYPVNYGKPIESIYMLKLTVPEGYVVDGLPAPKIMGLPNNAGRYTYSASQIGNTVNIISNFQINKNLFLQNEYAILREFYNQVVAKQTEQIVIKKK